MATSALSGIRKIENEPGFVGFQVCNVYDHLKDTSCHNRVIKKHATMTYIYEADLTILCQVIWFSVL